MKEEQNEFERLLKEKADRIEMKPSPFVWQQVQHGIQRDRRRRRFAWWLFATGCFAVLSTGALFMLNNKLDQPTSSSIAENISDGSNGVAKNSTSEKNNTQKNSSSVSASDHTSVAQNQSADNALTNNQREQISKNKNENGQPVIASSANSNSEESMKKKNEQQEEALVLLPSKEFALASQENSIDKIPAQITYFDFSSAPSNHSFLFEAEAMPLASFVWNKNTSTPLPQIGLATAALPAGSNSYSFVQGFSAGGNFFLEQNKLWLYGIGLHLTKTHLEAITAQQTIKVNDTTLVYDGNTYVAEVTTTDTIVYQSQHNINQWLDVSLMAGVKLFPSSKNHLRILAGAGYSRLLSDKNSNAITPKAYDLAFSTTSGGGNTAADSTGLPMVSYYKNQLQLFSEISYLRDLTSQLSFTAGMQLHYYPMNLLNSTELSQHMMWVGLKGGLVFRF